MSVGCRDFNPGPHGPEPLSEISHCSSHGLAIFHSREVTSFGTMELGGRLREYMIYVPQLARVAAERGDECTCGILFAWRENVYVGP